MALTDAKIRQAKPAGKPLKVWDERGLFLLIAPSGGKWWRLKYRHDGKEKLLSLGTYPDTTLALARSKRDNARRLLAQGIDPSAQRQAEKASKGDAGSFEVVAREWHGKQKWVPSHADRILRRFERDIFPWIGGRPVGEIEPPELLSVLRRIEGRGAVETAHRARQNCGEVFRYAIATGRAKRDPSADLRGALEVAQKEHYPAITDRKRVGQLLRDIDGYRGSLVVRAALRLSPLLYLRSLTFRHARWSEIDFDAAEWRAPAPRMKGRIAHIVPLPRQALEILRELNPLTAATGLLFPGARSDKKCISENTLNAALATLGYKGEMTHHGFRTTASTLLNEEHWNADAIELQLAHMPSDEVRAVYNRAKFLPERRLMMQFWADYLDALRDDKIPLKRDAWLEANRHTA